MNLFINFLIIKLVDVDLIEGNYHLPSAECLFK